MVCDASFLASTIISVMMDGMCCAWQMREADKTRESIRLDIRKEYERQRQVDEETWIVAPGSTSPALDDSHMDWKLGNADDWRRRLMMSKLRARKRHDYKNEMATPVHWNAGCDV